MFGTMYAAGTYPYAIYHLNAFGVTALGTGLLALALIPVRVATKRARKRGYDEGHKAGMNDPEVFMNAVKKMKDKGILEIVSVAAPASKETIEIKTLTPHDT